MLDVADATVGSGKRLRQPVVHAGQVVTGHLQHLVPVTLQQAPDLSGVLAGQHRGSCDLGAVEVENRQHRTVPGRVASLRDDVKAKSTRANIAAALVETLHTYRGGDADTAAERRALGQEVAALGKQLKDADTLVVRKAIIVEILALAEQRERGGFTEAERAELKVAVAKLKKAVVARTHGGAEGRAVAAAFSALHEQFTCTPA